MPKVRMVCKVCTEICNLCALLMARNPVPNCGSSDMNTKHYSYKKTISILAQAFSAIILGRILHSVSHGANMLGAGVGSQEHAGAEALVPQGDVQVPQWNTKTKTITITISYIQMSREDFRLESTTIDSQQNTCSRTDPKSKMSFLGIQST